MSKWKFVTKLHKITNVSKKIKVREYEGMMLVVYIHHEFVKKIQSIGDLKPC